MNETQAEEIKLAASNLAAAEQKLIAARKAYNKAQRDYDRACQTKLESS